MNWLSQLFQGIGNAAGGAGKAIGGALQSGGNFLSPIIQQGMKLGQGMGSTMGMFNTGKQAPGISVPKMQSFSSPMTQPGTSLMNQSGFGSLGINSQMPSIRNKLMNFQTPSMPGTTSKAEAPMGGDNDWMSQMFKGVNLPQLGIGAGINLAGNIMAPKVQTPNIQNSANYQALQNFKGGLAPGMEDAINRNLDIEQQASEKQLRDVYKNARPGTDYTTDSTYQRDLANLQRSNQMNRADAIAQAGNQYATTEQSRLAELASADIAQIMLETGMSYKEAEQFKQSFSNIGSQFISNAFPQQQGMDFLEEMFNRNKGNQNAIQPS